MVKVLIFTIISTYYLVSNIIPFMYSEYFISFSSNSFTDFPPLKPFPDIPDGSKSSKTKPSEKLSFDSIYSIFSSPEAPKCKPASFGYTEEQYWRIFPNKTFHRCNSSNESIMKIENKTLTMNCKGWYYKGTPTNNESIGLTDYIPKAQLYKTPVRLEDTQWAYGSCKKSKKVGGAAYKFYEIPEVKNRVKQTMTEMQQKYDKNKTSKGKTKPLTVINLFLDSISRKTFYRRLTKTIEFLNNLDREKFKVYDFKLHSVLADNSLPNLYPLWTGKHYKGKSKKVMQENKLKKEDLIYSESVWKDLRDKGWVTAFGVEFCNHYFAYGIGRNPKVDHTISQFWCGARSLLEYSDTSHDQRCIGSKYSHEYLFDYLIDYANSYTDLNKWAHVMCVTAHDDTGTVIATLDSDLANFLQRLVNSSQEFVLFMAADHGMRYGEWYKSENGGQEHKLPMLITLASSSLIESIEGSDEALRHNSGMLMTKRDLYHVLNSLGLSPYSRDPKEIYENKKNLRGVNLLVEKISKNRKCEDVDVPAEYCPCNEYRKFEGNHDSLLNLVAQYTLDEINESIYFNLIPGFSICKRLTLKGVGNAVWVSQGKKILIKLNFTIHEADEIFESYSMIFSKFMKQKPHEEGFKFKPMYVGGKRMFRLLGLQSNYSSKCKEKAWDLGIMPDLCICKS